MPFSAFFSSSIACTCQEIASPSRSGSVASQSRSAPFSALAIAATCLLPRSSALPVHGEAFSSGRTEPSFGGRSRTWPKLASTVKLPPRYLLIVLALAGDSTTTTSVMVSLCQPLELSRGGQRDGPAGFPPPPPVREPTAQPSPWMRTTGSAVSDRQPPPGRAEQREHLGAGPAGSTGASNGAGASANPSGSGCTGAGLPNPARASSTSAAWPIRVAPLRIRSFEPCSAGRAGSRGRPSPCGSRPAPAAR